MRRVLASFVPPVVILAWFGHAALTPIDHGIDRSAFQHSGEIAEQVEQLVRPIPGAEPRRPNLIVMLADDLGYGDISLQGGGTIDFQQNIITERILGLPKDWSGGELASPRLRSSIEAFEQSL